MGQHSTTVTGKRRAFFFFLTIFISTNVSAQFGSLNLWLRADAGTNTTTDGTAVTSWATQGVAGNSPTFVTTNPTYNNTGAYSPATFFNYNPSITFPGTGYMTIPAAAVSSMSAGNIFYVLRLTTNTQPSTVIGNWRELHNFGGSTAFYYGFPYNSAGTISYGDDFGVTGIVGLSSFNRSSINLNAVPGLNVTYPFIYNSGNEGALVLWSCLTYANSQQVFNTGYISAPSYTSGGFPVSIFKGFNATVNTSGPPLPATCAEILLVTGNPTAAERSNIESYLAIKYGITLLAQPKNYTATNNTVSRWTGGTQLTIWNSASNSAYNNNVIGIGRDGTGTLSQRQSKSVNVANSGNILSLSTQPLAQSNLANITAIVNPNSYLLVGDNNLGVTSGGVSDPQKPAAIYARIFREWFCQATNFTQNVTIGFDKTQLVNFLPLSNLRLLTDDDGDFTNATIETIPATLNATNSDIIEFADVSGIGTAGKRFFTLATVEINTPLPVGLISFNARCEGSEVLLEWSTGSEINSDFFTIEQSEDGQMYTRLGDIPAAGFSQELNNYQFRTAFDRKRIYRLSQTDLDGTREYFAPVSLDENCINREEILLSPNPVGSGKEMRIDYVSERPQEVAVRFVDALGRMNYSTDVSFKKGSGYVQLVLPDLSPGIYTVVFQSEFIKTDPLKLVVQ